MKCTVDTNKVTQAIKDKIINQVPSNLFKVNGDIITSSINMSPIEFNPNMEIVNRALKFSKEINDSHRQLFETEPIGFLKELAYNANIDEKEAMTIASPYIIKLAKDLFPYEGKQSPQAEFIDKINKDFKSNIFKQISPTDWKIDIPTHIIMAYIAMDVDGFNTVAAYAREEFIKKMGISINLIEEHNWVNFGELANPNLQNLLKFMKKINPKAKVGLFSDLDVKAVSLISDYIIMLKAGDTFEEIPHEVAHFFFELLPDNHPMKVEMLKSIIDLPKYAEVYRVYKNNIFYQKNGKPDINKIKREAAAQLIGDYVKAAFNEKADEKYGKKRSFIKRLVNGIIKAVRKLLYIKVPVYYEHTQNPFKEAASQILNQDISQLDLQKAHSPYDSIFFSEVEEQKEEGHELGQAVKQLQIFTSAMKRRLGTLFRDDINNSKYEAFKAQLQDGDINRAFAIVDRMKAADDMLKLMLNENTYNHITIINAIQNLSASYKAFEILPDAIRAALKVMKESNRIEDFLNNMRELSDYSNLSKNFKKLTGEFEKLLRSLETTYPGDTEEDINTKNKLITSIKSVIEKGSVTFVLLDATVHEEFKYFYSKFLKAQAGKWVDELLNNKIKEFNLAERSKLKSKLLNEIYGDPLLSPDSVYKMLQGKLGRRININPDIKLQDDILNSDNILFKGGVEVSTSDILDTDNLDMGIFFATAPSLVRDPLITTTVKYIYESIATGKVKGYQETIQFLNEIMPITDSTKVEWYKMNEMLHSVQPIYSPSLPNKKREVRVFLSETKRFQFFYDKSLLRDNITSIEIDISQLKGLQLNDPNNQSLITKLNEKRNELEAKKKEYADFIKKWSYRPYKDIYYETIDKLKENKADSETLRRIKIIKEKLKFLKERQSSVFLLNIENSADINFAEHPEFIRDSNEISRLETELMRLSENLPETDKSLLEELDNLYEIDEQASIRLRENHKTRMISSALTTLSNINVYNKSTEQLYKDLLNAYNAIYTIHRPTEEFYKLRQELYEQIANLSGKYGELLPYKQMLEDLYEKEKELKRYLYTESGEVDLFSAMNIRLNEDKPIISEFRELEIDSKYLRDTMSNLMLHVNLGGPNMETSIIRYEMVSAILYTNNIVNEIKKYEESIKDGVNLQFIERNIKKLREKIKKVLSNIGNISDSELSKLILAVSSSANMSELSNNLRTIDFNYKDNNTRLAAGTGLMIIADTSYADNSVKEGIESIIDRMVNIIKSQVGGGAYYENYQEINDLWTQLEDMSGKTVTHNYTMMMQSFLSYADRYINDENYSNSVYRLDHAEALDIFKRGAGASLKADIKDWEDLLGSESDGLFSAVIDYMINIYKDIAGTDEGEHLLELISFYKNLHITKFVKNEYGERLQITPLRLATKIDVKDKNLYTIEYPRFLNFRKVKDEYRTEKIYDTDPRVISGQLSATIDIHGRWLPLPKKGEYWNEEYEKLKNDPSRKNVYNLLEKLKLYSLQRQQELTEEDRFDLQVPAMTIDEYEEFRNIGKNPKDALKYATSKTPFAGLFDTKEGGKAEMEQIGFATQEVYDRYSGKSKSFSEDDDVKLMSTRNIPIYKQSVDAVSAMAMFIADLNVYKSKNLAKPIVKGVRDMFIRVHEETGTSKNRAKILSMLYDTHLLSKIPENFFNLPQIANFVNFAMSIAGLKLAGDIIGSIVNIGSGQMQLLIEASVSKEAAQIFASASRKAMDFAYEFEKDFFHRENQGLKSQIIYTFNMLPDNRQLHHQLSWKHLASGIRSNLMKVRSEPENALAIQTALSIIISKSNITDKSGKRVEFYDIYTLKDGVIALKDEYSYLDAEWNPVNGTEVIKLRSGVMQFYTLLHGNYYKEMESWISRFSVGRAFEMMKKYMGTMMLNRYQSRVMDVFLEKERIGSHRALTKFLVNFIKGFRDADSEEVAKYMWTNPMYSHGIRRSISELAWLILYGIMIPLVFGYDDDDENRNKKLAKMSYEKQIALLIALRLQGELGTFIPLPIAGLGYMEMKRALFDPFGVPKSAVDNMSAILKYSFQHLIGDTDDLYYKNKKKYNYWAGGIGAFKDKGDSKLFATILNTVGYTGYTFEPAPYIMTFSQIQNKVR